MSKRRNHRSPVPPTTTINQTWTRDADDRMVTLLGDLQEARSELAHALPEYVRALKGWASLVETMTKYSVNLVDALFARYDLGTMTDAQMAMVVKEGNHEPDVAAAWRTLNDSAERFYRARVKMVTRQSAAMGYIQYVENLKVKEDRDFEDVPTMLLRHMEDATVLIDPAEGHV